MKKSLFASALLVCALQLSAQTVDSEFSLQITTESVPTGILLFNDASYLVYGDFKRVNGQALQGVAKYNSDGTIDESFLIGNGANHLIEAAALQADGKVLLAGRFTAFNGQPRQGIVRLNPDGSIDETFSTNVELLSWNVPFELAVQSDGKILFAGPLDWVDGVQVPEPRFVRLNTDGTLDTSFKAPAELRVSDIEVQTEKIIVSGNFEGGIARLNSDGSIDMTFNIGSGLGQRPNDVDVAPTGEIYVIGLSEFNGQPHDGIIRLLPDGTLDESYNNETDVQPISGIVVLPDGKVLACASAGASSYKPVRFNVDGTVDPTLVAVQGTDSFVYQMGANSNGDIALIGSFETYGGQDRHNLAVMDSEGTLKPMVAQPKIQKESSPGVITAISDSQFLIGFDGEANDTGVRYFARVNLDGTLDDTFSGNSQPDLPVQAICVDHNGNILIGGFFENFGNMPVPRLARLTSDGNLDATFTANTGSGFNGVVDAIVEQPDGKIIVAGNFTTFNGGSRNAIVRLNADGTLDETFNTADGFAGADFDRVFDVVVQADGKILVAGEFSSFDGHEIYSLLRLNVDGTLDETFQIGTGVRRGGSTVSAVYAIELLSGGRILAGGSFDEVNGADASYLAVLNADGTFNDSFQFAPSFFIVDDIAKQADGKFLVLDRSWGIRRLTAEGKVDPTFTVLMSEYTSRVVEVVGNSIIVGGPIFTMAGHPVLGVTKLNLPAGAPMKPGILDATDIRINSVRVSWSPVEDATGYFLERSTPDNQNFQLLGTIGQSDTTYLNFDLSEDTPYVYRVAAFNAAGTSPYSDELSVRTDQSPPDAPWNLVLTVAAVDEIHLEWDDNADNETMYEIWRAEDDISSIKPMDTVAADIVFYADRTVADGTYYYYQVRAINRGGNSGFSNQAGVQAHDPTPAVPSALSASSADNYQIVVTWNDNSNNETGFEVERAEDDGTFQLLYTTKANTSQYFDRDVLSGKTYRYRVRAYYLDLFSAYTDEAVIQTSFVGPRPPSNLVLTSPTTTSIQLTWIDHSSPDDELVDDETDFVIYRKLLNAPEMVQHAFLAANSTSFIDKDLTPGLTYVYRVSARNETATSLFIEGLRTAGIVPMADQELEACEGLFFDSGVDSGYGNNEDFTTVIHPAVEGTSVQLTFEAFFTFVEDELKIYDGTVADPAALIGTYSDINAPGTINAPNTGALTLVFASNEYNFSTGWKATIGCVTLPDAPPSDLTLDVGNLTEVKLSWKDVATNEAGYVVERSQGNASNFVSVAMVPANTITFADNLAESNTTYYYRVKAAGVGGATSDPTPTRAIAFGNGGVWRLKADFDGLGRTDAVAFAVDSKAYVGLGWAGGVQALNISAYDAVSDTWTSVNGFDGLVRSEAASFAIGDKGYVGLGEWIDRENDFWEYDPGTDTWTQKANFGGTPRTGAVGFSLAGKGYFGLGRDDAGYTNDFWQYDPAGNAWTQVESFPGNARNAAVAFVIGNFAYVGTGYDGSARLSDFYRYDPADNSWTAVAAFPGEARRSAVAFAIDGKGYVGTGDGSSDKKDFWRYDPVLNAWEEIVSFGGTPRLAATAFAIGGKGYVTTGFDGAERKDLWQFTPSAIAAAPTAPAELVVVSTLSTEIGLEWSHSASEAHTFVVERSTESEASGFEVRQTLGEGITTYTDTGLDPETVYYYRVKALSENSGGSAYSPVISATTLPLPPEAPSNLTASAGSSSNVELTWLDKSTNETGFIIERSAENNADFTEIGRTSAGITEFIDTGIGFEVTAYYRVRAHNTGGHSDSSNEVVFDTGPSPLEPPTGLLAEVRSAQSILLTWTDNSDNETLFSVHRSTDPDAEFELVANLIPNTTEYMDVALLANTTYYYEITATLGSVVERSGVASATTLNVPPAAPTDLVATFDEINQTISLAWTDASDNEELFVIERSTDGDEFAALGEAATANYTDETPGEIWKAYYRVAARNNGGTSAYSNVAQVIIASLEPEARLQNIQAFPNPARDVLTVAWRSPKLGTVEIAFYDLTGRALHRYSREKVSVDFQARFLTSELANQGTVLLKMTLDGEIVLRKIIIE